MDSNKRCIIACLITISLIAFDGYHGAVTIPAPSGHMLQRLDAKTGNLVEPTIIILHFTEESLGTTLKIFMGHTAAKVTPHYTVSEDGVIFQHADEHKGARHAGISYWDGKTELNRYAIGIEHVNQGFKHRDAQAAGIVIEGSDKEWYPFTSDQITASIALCKYLVEKYNIEPRNVVGHCDVAPGRKMDPGPLFPWQKFAEHGVGAWPSCETVELLSCLQHALATDALEAWLIKHLHIWGYKLPDETTSAQDIIQAFQMHFRQHNICGKADRGTASILNNLLCTSMFKKHQCVCQQP